MQTNGHSLDKGRQQGVPDRLVRIVVAFDRVISWLDSAKLGKWCLIAGTPVMTMAGPLPVERIEPGMMVLSAPECGTGAPAFRPVAGVSRNRVKELVRISYDHDGSAATPDETITASTGHPFWIEEARAFVPAADVRPGQHLRLAEEGRSAAVAAVSRQRAPPGPGVAVFNFSVAGHRTYFAGNGGVWVHNACQHLDDFVLGAHKSILDDLLRSGHGDDLAHDIALEKATEILRSRKHDAKILTQTGAELFENTPSIVRGAAADDVARVRKYLADTGLGIAPNQPAVLVRSGDGGQPFFATPKARMPDDWAELASKMQSEMGLVPRSQAWIAAEHCEALGLKRAVDRLGPGVTEFDIATAGQYVCGHCVADDGISGLAQIAQKLGLTKVRMRSELGFQTADFRGDSAVTILIDQGTKTWQILKGIH